MILSILRTGHHPVFQHWCVRTSMGHYPHFILPMRRSRGFASTAADCIALFGLAFAPALPQSGLAWPGTVSRRVIMQKARRQARGQAPIALRPLCGRVVSGSLTSPRRGSSHRSLALLCAIGRQGVLSLAGWSPRLRAGFHVAGLTQESAPTPSPVTYGPFTPSGAPFRVLRLGYRCLVGGPTTPGGRVPRVWAGPRSLAATEGVAVAFCSSGY